ncbi:E3 ubiquitin-protein ligase NRDP1-like isoform X2 [Ascaphus truei]|uniref:E3 ubiquitin-protein ligase NRDP1-like isoform X2 n=1 Tax=Ascaphus truei TaxID=8439 RepID=UPI003F594AE8
MGYDIERFLGYVNEGLLCCICRDVLEEPLQAPCEHAFCASCIHGWLVHHHNCPEDRQALSVTGLRPLHRYMRNDLSRLQIQCKNRGDGCTIVCSLELIDRHERECDYGRMPCINAGCPAQLERRNLEAHLAVCEHRSRECPNGCGYTILSAEDLQHNCTAELRTELELLRSEMICRVEETKQEMESRLDSQRRHMSQMSRVMSDVVTLMASERQHRQDLDQADLEKRELMELLKGLQKECRPKNADSQKPANMRPLTRLESIKRKSRDVTVI